MSVIAMIYGDFVDFERFWAAKNKAKQTQFQAIALPEGIGKREKSVSVATG
jgi:hypothetical protein